MSTDRRQFLRASLATGALIGLGRGTTPGFGAEPKGRGGKAEVSKRLLILGGTGFLGPQIVEEAIRRGHTVTLFNRGKTRPGLFPDVEKLLGDRNNDLKALEGRSWDAVIDPSANVPRWVKMSGDLLAPNVKRSIYISSISVYEDTSKPGMDETSPVSTIKDETTETVDGRTFGALKALSEKAAEKAMPGRVAVVRPGLIVGPDDPSDRFTYWPVRVARGGEVLCPGTGDDPVQLIDVRDLGGWLVRLVEDETTGVFNALGPDRVMTMKAMLDACRKAEPKTNATFTWADAEFLGAEKVQSWADMPAWVPGQGESAGFGRISNARALKAGLTFRPIEDTAKATLDWFKTLPEARRAKLKAGISAEREAKVLAAWHAHEKSREKTH